MTQIIGIDPGTRGSGWVVLGERDHVLEAAVMTNEAVLEKLHAIPPSPDLWLAIEWVSSYGMAVGREVFETCRWIGRMQQAWHRPEHVQLITRSEVKLALCHSARAKDTNVRQALIDLYAPTGAGRVPQIGTVKRKGPLYGVHSHAWSALALAVVAASRISQITHERLHLDERIKLRRQELHVGFDSRLPGEAS